MPSAKIGLIVGALFCFILSFGDFISPYYLGGSSPPTLSILIIDTTKSGQQWPRAAKSGRRGRRGRLHDDNPVYDSLRGHFLCLPEASIMIKDGAINLVLTIYLALVFLFVFTPTVSSIVFSFNSDRFPTIPLGDFTLHWYQLILSDPDMLEAATRCSGTCIGY